MLQHQMVIAWSDEDNCYLVHLPDFPDRTYHANGSSYVEAATRGQEVLQRLVEERSILQPAVSSSKASDQQEMSVHAESTIPSSPDQSASQPATRLAAVEPTDKYSSPEAEGNESVAVASKPASKQPPFPWFSTAIASIVTSVVAVVALVAIAAFSESLVSRMQASTRLSETAGEESLDSLESEPTESDTALAASTDSDASTASTAISDVPKLTLANTVTESSTVWAIATYSEPSRNINLIIDGTENGQVAIRDRTSGEPIRTIQAHNDKVRAIAVASSAGRFVTSSGDGIKVWDLEGNSIYSLSATSPVWSVAISPDENRFVTGAYDGTITVWNLENGDLIDSIDSGATVWSLAFLPNGKSFVSGGSDRTIRQWDLATGNRTRTFVGHQDAVRAVAVSADGQTLASGSWDKTIKVWSLATGDLQSTLEGHQDSVVSLAFNGNGEVLASGSVDASVKRWRLSDYRLVDTLNAPFDWVLAVVYAEDQTLITGGKDREIRVWQ